VSLSPRAQPPYREVLNTPGIARAHDFQRIVSYGVAVVLCLLIDLPEWRANTALVISVTMLSGAVWRLTRGSTKRPYVLAWTDQLAAGMCIALATASPVITTAAVVFITASVGATFRSTVRTTAGFALATGIPPIAVSLAVDGGGDTADSAYVAALILIVVMLALAAFIVGLFIVQTRHLRSELSHRESQLNSILEVTPVVLAAVAADRTLATLAGNSATWREVMGRSVEAPQDIVDLVTEARAAGRSTGDIAIGDRTFNVTCDASSDGAALLTAYDVTDSTLARKRLEEVVRSKDQFIAAVSHELRTPLASVLGFSELVREQMEQTHPLEPFMMEVADQSAEMAAIIDDLLIAARASFESVPTEPREINLAAEATAVIETMGSRLVSQPDRKLSDVVAYADPIRVRQIVRNLLTNADRYGGDTVVVTSHIEDDDAVLIVKDSGRPLPTARRELIFEPYESSGPVRGQPAAIGLGLAVSRTLAELMHGSINYDHDGKWSVFELRLPRIPVQVTSVNANF
jgi:signal transduction histidine kinase